MSQLTLSLKQTLTQFELSIDHTFSLSGIHGIFGHSGSGKSTLLRCIAGLEKDAIGEIKFNDECLQSSPQKQFIKPEQRAIGYLFQQSQLFPHLNVLENLTYAEKRKKQHNIQLTDLIDSMHLSTILTQHVGQLSGGERQKVALARAIINEPRLLLLDEPLSALDRASKLMMMKLISDVHQQFSIPMLYVSHSLDELQQLGTTITVLEQGKVIASGDTHSVIHKMNHQLNQKTNHADIIAKQTSLSAKIIQQDNGYGLTELLSDSGIRIFMPSEHLLPHHQALSHLRCFILASDISICLHESEQSSIVNHFSATITDIKTEQQHVLITLSVNEQQFFASISAFSLEKLTLSIGQAVYIQCKASAVRSITI